MSKKSLPVSHSIEPTAPPSETAEWKRIAKSSISRSPVAGARSHNNEETSLIWTNAKGLHRADGTTVDGSEPEKTIAPSILPNHYGLGVKVVKGKEPKA